MGSYQQPSPQRSFTPIDDPGGEQRRSVLLAVSETSLLGIILGSVAIAYAFPFQLVKYGIAAFFGVLLMGQILQRPPLALAMLAFAAPATGLVSGEFIPIPGFNGETALILLLLLVWGRSNQMHGSDGLRSPLSVALLIYAVLVVATAMHSIVLWSVPAMPVLSTAKNHLAMMMFFPAALHVIREPRDRWLTFIACSLAILLNALQAIHGSLYAFFVGSLERYRAGALISPQPNVFGAFLVLALPVLVALALRRFRNPLFNLWCLLVAGAAGFAMLLTLSRASWIGLIAAMAVLALIWDRRLLVVFAVLAATYSYWLPQDALERVKETTDSQSFDYEAMGQVADDSAQMRIEQYKSLPAMMAPKPLFGWGYHSFPRVFAEHGTLGRPKGAHSTYCLIATEAGIVGLLIFGVLFFLILRATVGGARRLEDPLLKWMAVGLTCSAIGILVAMAGGERFQPQIVWVYFWVMLAMVERERLLERRTRSDSAEAGAES